MHLLELRLSERALHSAGEVARDRTDRVERVLEGLADGLEFLARLLESHERDQRAEDLVGAFEDQVDARVAERALVRRFLGVADAAGDLHRLARGAERELRREDLAGGSLEREVHSSAVDHASAEHPAGVGGVTVGGGERDLLLDHLERPDRPPELLALLGVFDRVLHHRAGAARGAGRESEAAGVEDLERDLESAADVAEEILRGDHHVRERHRAGVARLDAHLLLDLAKGDAGRVGVDDEGGDALLLLAVDHDRDLGEHSEDARVAGVGDPDLRAVHHIVLAVGARDGGGAHGLRVGARARLGQTEGADQLSRGATREPLLLLRLCAEEDDPLDADALVRAEVDRECCVVRADLAEDAREDERRSAKATVRLGDVEPHEAELGHAGAHFVGELGVMIELRRIERVLRPAPEGVEDLYERLAVLRTRLGERKDEVLSDLTLEHAACEGRVLVWVGEMRGVRCGGHGSTGAGCN